MKCSTKDITLLGICIALTVAAGFALLHVPNFELITSLTFLSGLFLGSARGTLVGAVSMFLFSFFNPLGVPFIPVLMAQVLFMGVAGFAGGIWRRWVRKSTFCPLNIAGLAGTGLILTLLYDVGTNVGFALSAGFMSQWLKIVAAGVVFSSIHLVTNTALFGTLVPALVRVMKIEGEKTES
ncbi:MAG: ECF transporter S component [Gemmatimonadota bacterium]|nr:MAG: ECF transporter S component [Gemmatimonadota bacterium]